MKYRLDKNSLLEILGIGNLYDRFTIRVPESVDTLLNYPVPFVLMDSFNLVLDAHYL